MQGPPGNPFPPGGGQGAAGAPGQPQPGQPGAGEQQQAGYPQQPGYPAPQQPGYGAPGQQPGYGAPGQQPGYGAPGQQPGYGAPGQQPGYGAPGQQPAQPGYVPPQQPGYGAPGLDYGAPPAETRKPVLSEAERKREMGRTIRIAGVMIFVFGIVCLITSAVFGSDDGKTVSGTLPATGGILGPIVTTKDNTVLEITVHEALNGYGWSYLDGEMLDKDKEYLFGFGYEFWHETGYDEGRWDEQKNKFSFKITVPKKGTYYAHLYTEQPKYKQIGGNISAWITPEMGSSVPYFAAGLVGLIGGVFFFVVGAMMTPATVGLDDDDDDDD